MRFLVAGAVSAGVLLLAACTSSPSAEYDPPAVEPKRLGNDAALLVEPEAPQTDFIPQARVEGRLRQVGRCLVVSDSVAYWPFGSSYDTSRRTVTLPEGQTVRVGQTIDGSAAFMTLGEGVPPSRVRRIEGLRECLTATSLRQAVYIAAVG
ncbi:hypothetical protein [uncultured Nocardioides sp.]|uniref:hypothetical protein n=1 Tax=uncultured Nocardioides sp. TaxID=198441 RepID=UPI00260BA7E4|nr:hypothetical protein [uncultured Nocardioides sp.]